MFFFWVFSSSRYEKRKNFFGANLMGYWPNYIVRRENSGELDYCILGVAGKLLEVLKNFFFFFCARQKLDWRSWCRDILLVSRPG